MPPFLFPLRNIKVLLHEIAIDISQDRSVLVEPFRSIFCQDHSLSAYPITEIQRMAPTSGRDVREDNQLDPPPAADC